MLRSIARRGVNCCINGTKIRSASYSDKSSDNKDDEENYWKELPTPEDPVGRTVRVMSQQMRDIKQKIMFWKEPGSFQDEWVIDSTIYPRQADIVIIGGAAMGSSIAYWIKKIAGEGLSVVVIEKDPSYNKASTVLSVGGLRQQFSMEENIEMSLFGADFIRNAQEYLGIDGEPPIDLQFRPYGYLYLASEAGAQQLTENSKLQNKLGAKNILLTSKQIKERFPWINTNGIDLGCLGMEKEGWFDPWSLLNGLKKKAIHLGAQYHIGEVKAFSFHNTSNVIYEGQGPESWTGTNNMIVKSPTGEKQVIEFAICVIAAGADSGNIAKLAKIGNGPGVLTVPLPVVPRKRFVYCFDAPDGPTLNTPMVIDPSGAYFRREGLAGTFITGKSPDSFDEEPSIDNLDVDDDYFHNKIWPLIANRVPSFEKLKLKSSWAGYYDYNYFDENGIIGQHPLQDNVVFATGFSGHGIQQAPAVGRAVMEHILHCKYRTIDLTRLGFDRFISLEKMKEKNII